MDEEIVVSQYCEGVSLTQIAQLHNVSVDKIRWCLQKRGVWKPAKPHKYNLDEQSIVDFYKKDIPINDISTLFGVSIGPIVRILAKHGVRKPNQFKTLPYALYQKVIDKEYFLSLVKQHVSKKEVGKVLGIPYDMVASLYKYHGIKNLSSGEIRSLVNRSSSTLELTRDNVILYHKELFYPIKWISAQMKVSVNFLRKQMRLWKIKPNPPGQVRWSSEFRKLANNVDKIKEEIQKYPILHLCKKYKVNVNTFSRVLQKHNISLPFRSRSLAEQTICKILDDSDIDYSTNVRNLISPYEVDILVPSHKLAIEYCGMYWHGERYGRGEKYHLTKLDRLNKLGYRLITIFEDEYNKSPDLIHQKILFILNKSSIVKANARDCRVQEIKYKEKKIFLDKYHIQGNDVSHVYLGLFLKQELVAVMTFARPSRARQSKNNMSKVGVWELNRYATSSQYCVRGGAGKLLSYFQTHHQWNQIYSYADRRWSNGDMYYKLGFRLSGITKPNYWYVAPGKIQREYRYNYTKYRLVEQGYDESKTEKQIMESRGYDRVWDCGMLKFVMLNNERGLI